jgi:predicted nucleotidyltransferase
MSGFRELLRALSQNKVEVILVGGMAATAHGSPRLTEDIDFVYRRTSENIVRLVETLAPYSPYPRGAPPGLPFRWDKVTLSRGLNFTLTTSLGPIDLFGEITGGGGYEELQPQSIRLSLFGTEVDCLDLEPLIKVKRAAGRPKDLEALAELEAIREEKEK